jgi:serine/threonine-protein kinase
MRAEADTAIRLAPDLPQAHLALGLAKYRVRDYRGGLEEFAIALRGLPNDSTLRTHIGAVHRRLGHWDDAVAEYRKAAQAGPRDAENFADLGGTTFLYLRRFREATEAFDHALSLAPDLHFAAVSKGLTEVIRDGRLDALRASLEHIPRDASLGQLGSSVVQHAQLLLWARQSDDLLRVLKEAPGAVFDAQRFYLPTSLFAGWAHQLRGDGDTARAAFASALAVVDSAIVHLADDWRLHAARGLALGGLGRRDEALREAEWLRQSAVYREDALHGPLVAEDRARILAAVGDRSAAIDEVERLLARPSLLSVHTLRLDPRWDPIREDPRFTALLARAGR